MNCTQFRGFSGAFADGELDASMTRKASDHLDSCPQCAQQVEQIHRFKAALRRTFSDEAVPEQLRKRVIASLETDDSARTSSATQESGVWHRFATGGRHGFKTRATLRRYTYLAPVAVAATLALAATVWLLAPRTNPLQDHVAASTAQIVEDVRAQHRACVTKRGAGHHDPSLSRGLATIAERLSARLSLTVIVPDLSPDGFELTGADRCGIPGHDGAHVLYGSPSTGATLSLYTVERLAAMRPNTTSHLGDREYFAATDAAETVVAWHRGGQTYISCGELGKAQIMEMMGRVRVATSPSVLQSHVAMLSLELN